MTSSAKMECNVIQSFALLLCDGDLWIMTELLFVHFEYGIESVTVLSCSSLQVLQVSSST